MAIYPDQNKDQVMLQQNLHTSALHSFDFLSWCTAVRTQRFCTSSPRIFNSRVRLERYIYGKFIDQTNKQRTDKRLDCLTHDFLYTFYQDDPEPH